MISLFILQFYFSEAKKIAEFQGHGQCSDTVISGQEKTSSSKKTGGKDSFGCSSGQRSPRRDPVYGLPFAVVKFNDPKTIAALEMNTANQRRLEAKRRFRYCYECGRSLSMIKI